MTVSEIRQTAFAKMMLMHGPHWAVCHLFDCLKSGGREENIGWMLMDAVHGERYFITEDTLSKAVDALVGDA